MKVGGKSEWWSIVIGWEENVCGEVVIFKDLRAKSCYILGRRKYILNIYMLIT